MKTPGFWRSIIGLLVAVVLCRRERPVSWYRVIVVTLIAISLAWVAKEWLHVHRHW